MFEDCEFKNSYIGFGVDYIGCRWTKCKLWGKYSGIGRRALYEDCSFEDVFIRTASFDGTTLRRCAFSGKFQTLIWVGEGAKDKDRRLRLESCDMSRLTFSNVNIYGGVDLSTVQLPATGIRVFANPDGALQRALKSAARALSGHDAINLEVAGGDPYNGQDPVVWDDHNLEFSSARTRLAFEQAVAEFEIAR